MADPDAQLAARCRSGDRAALELLFRRYVDRVWRYGWFVTRSREAAAEIVQETFLRVVKSVGGFEGRSTFATWLFALTRSAAMEFLRRERQEKRHRLDSGSLRLVTADEVREIRRDLNEVASESEGEESHGALQKAFAELSGGQRDAVVLCELAGMSIAEAAEVLGWSKPRVKVTLFRARRRLREILTARAANEAKSQCEKQT